MTTPIPTLEALRLVLEAARKVADHDYIADEQLCADVDALGAALAAWDARVPLGDDTRLKRELFQEVAAAVKPYEAYAVPGDYATEALRALDAKLGERRG